jgi:hypothetical protein
MLTVPIQTIDTRIGHGRLITIDCHAGIVAVPTRNRSAINGCGREECLR